MVAQKAEKRHFGPTFFKQINVIFHFSKNLGHPKGPKMVKKMHLGLPKNQKTAISAQKRRK